MFKRVLVLVIFLFGVFWWLTSRDDEPKEPNTEVVTVETENVEGEADADSEEGEEAATTEEGVVTPVAEVPVVEVVPDVVVTPQPVAPTPTTVTPVVQTETTVVQTETPVAEPVAPVVPAPKPVAPKPVAVEIPDRTTDVKVYMYEWGLDLSDKTIPAGTINFMVQNDGAFTHDLNISGFGNLGKILPRQKATFTLKLAAGEYDAFSERRQDYERGVREAFVVTE
jgi:hypothetical protein